MDQYVRSTFHLVWLVAITTADRELMGVCASEARADGLIADKMEDLELSYADFVVEPVGVLDDDWG